MSGWTADAGSDASQLTFSMRSRRICGELPHGACERKVHRGVTPPQQRQAPCGKEVRSRRGQARRSGMFLSSSRPGERPNRASSTAGSFRRPEGISRTASRARSVAERCAGTIWRGMSARPSAPGAGRCLEATSGWLCRARKSPTRMMSEREGSGPHHCVQTMLLQPAR